MAISVKRKRPSEKLLEDDRFKPVVVSELVEHIIEPKDNDMPVDVRDLQSIAGDPILSISNVHLERLAALGHRIGDLGTVRINNGVLLATTETAVTCINVLRRQVENHEDTVRSARAVAMLGNTVAHLSKEFRELNDSSPHKSPRRSASFNLGKPVSLTQNNYYGTHGTDKKTG